MLVGTVSLNTKDIRVNFLQSGQGEILRLAQNESEGIRMAGVEGFSAACVNGQPPTGLHGTCSVIPTDQNVRCPAWIAVSNIDQPRVPFGTDKRVTLDL